MMTYESIKKEVLGETDNIPNIILRSKKRTNMMKHKQFELEEDIRNDPTIICSIHIDQTSLLLLSSYKKQKSPISYIYIDNINGYIIFIVKILSYYPIVFLKLEINDITTYVNKSYNENMCFEFEMNQLNIKQLKSKCNQYQLIIRNAETLQMEFISKSVQTQKTITLSLKSINNDTINRLFTFDNDDNVNFQINNKDPIVNFDTSNIVMISNTIDINNVLELTNNRNSNCLSRFHIQNNNIDFMYSTGDDYKERYTICNKDDSIYWEFHTTNLLLNIEGYDNLFKMNYQKILTTKNKLYYVILSFADIYLFVKTIYSGTIDISENKRYLFIDIFNQHNQILEIYILTQV